jgi:hypothetical protein
MSGKKNKPYEQHKDDNDQVIRCRWFVSMLYYDKVFTESIYWDISTIADFVEYVKAREGFTKDLVSIQDFWKDWRQGYSDVGECPFLFSPPLGKVMRPVITKKARHAKEKKNT